jgi:hypothetical protein
MIERWREGGRERMRRVRPERGREKIRERERQIESVRERVRGQQREVKRGRERDRGSGGVSWSYMSVEITVRKTFFVAFIGMPRMESKSPSIRFT